MSHLYNGIEKPGEIFGTEDKAQVMIPDMKTWERAIADRVSTLEDTDKVAVLTVQMVCENEFSGRKGADLACGLIEKAGGICLDEAFRKQNIENLITLNPDVLAVINRTNFPAQERIDALKSNLSLNEVNVVKNDHFVPLDYVDFYGGNHEAINAIESPACGFYPELFFERPKGIVT